MALKKSTLVTLLKLSIAIIILYFLASHANIDLTLLARLYQQPFLFFSVVAIFLLMVVLAGWRWWLLNNSQTIYLPLLKTLSISYLGSAYNNVLPSAVGGDVVRAYYVFKSVPNKKSSALLALFADRALGFIAVIISICTIAILRISLLSAQPKLLHLFMICVVFCVGIFFALGSALWLLKRTPLYTSLDARFGQNKWLRPIISLLGTLRAFRLDMKVVVPCLALSIIIQLLIVVAIVILAHIMNFPPLAIYDYVVAVGVTQIVNLIPITPGGIGIGEMAFANVLMLLNPELEAPVATVFFAYRLVSAVSYLPAFLTYIPGLCKSLRKRDLSRNVVEKTI